MEALELVDLQDDPPTLRRALPSTLPALRVLLAEDDDDLRSLLAATMRNDGHDVIEVRDGRELHARLHDRSLGATTYDVVVSDVLMPGATGVTVLTGLANTVKPPRIIVISAFGDWDLHQWAASIGAVAMFDKPFDPDDLRTVLMNLGRHERKPSE
jgi:DNA-binding response OmpR family regulator